MDLRVAEINSDRLLDGPNSAVFVWCEQAEELMRKIEKEEERVAYDQPDKKVYHLCIVNLVIGYVIKKVK